MDVGFNSLLGMNDRGRDLYPSGLPLILIDPVETDRFFAFGADDIVDSGKRLNVHIFDISTGKEEKVPFSVPIPAHDFNFCNCDDISPKIRRDCASTPTSVVVQEQHSSLVLVVVYCFQPYIISNVDINIPTYTCWWLSLEYKRNLKSFDVRFSILRNSVVSGTYQHVIGFLDNDKALLMKEVGIDVISSRSPGDDDYGVVLSAVTVNQSSNSLNVVSSTDLRTWRVPGYHANHHDLTFYEGMFLRVGFSSGCENVRSYFVDISLTKENNLFQCENYVSLPSVTFDSCRLPSNSNGEYTTRMGEFFTKYETSNNDTSLLLAYSQVDYFSFVSYYRLCECHGIPRNSSSVCSSFGKCISEDNRVCSYGHTGTNCELLECFHFPENDPNVCSGRGKCTNVDHCECFPHHFEKDCSKWTCFGIMNNEKNVCSGNGNCSDVDQCSCFLNYTEMDCSMWSCWGKEKNATNVCSCHGNCTSPNHCKCGKGFSGEICGNFLLVPNVIGAVENQFDWGKFELIMIVVVCSMVPLCLIIVVLFVCISWVTSFFCFKNEEKYKEKYRIIKEEKKIVDRRTEIERNRSEFERALVGTVFHDFKILKFIDGGSYGLVFQVELQKIKPKYEKFQDIKLAMKVALNYMDSSCPTQQIEYLLEEFRAELPFNDNLVRIFFCGAGKVDTKAIQTFVYGENGNLIMNEKTAFFIMELCDGSLKRLFSQRPVFVDKEFYLFLSHIVNGLRTLRENRIVHCDVKPANILYKEEESGQKTFLVGDYGVVFRGKQIQEGFEHIVSYLYQDYNENSSPVRGTHIYCPHEIRELTDRRSGEQLPVHYDKYDIFSLGVTCFQLFNQDWKPGAKLDSKECPNEGISRLIGRMTEKEYAHRISFEELEIVLLRNISSEFPDMKVEKRFPEFYKPSITTIN